MDDGDSLSNASSVKYIIFSACGYGNMGDDAIMLLGTARYLITREKAIELFIFSYSPKETQQLLENAGLTSLATIRAGLILGLLRALLSRTQKKRIVIGGGTLITNRIFLALYYLIPAIMFKLLFSRSLDVYFFVVAAEETLKRPFEVCIIASSSIFSKENRLYAIVLQKI
jgi:hypothetical protein